jgi:hypothetical protein
MRKGFLLVILLGVLLPSGVVSADMLLSLGPGVQFASQRYSLPDQNRMLEVLSVGVQASGFYGGAWGLQTRLLFTFYPVDITWAGSALDPGTLTFSTLDVTLGLGYRRMFGRRLGVILGAGLHGAQLSVLPTGPDPEFGTDVAFGPGALLSLLFALRPRLVLAVEFQAAYDLLALATHPRPDRTLRAGFSTGAALTVGVVL